MSRALVAPEPQVARPVGAVLFLGLALIHFLSLPHGFHIEAYVGVSLLLASVMAVAGAVALLVEDRNRVWWYALAEGLLTLLGWFLSRWFGLPAAGNAVSGDWFEETGLGLAFCGSALTGLAVWILYVRRTHAHETVLSARQRVLTR
jgi:hypothetical protein